MRASLNGVSADEVTRSALADGLFSTSTLGPQVGWLAHPIDPLRPLRGLALDDSILRPVARLLFGERLFYEQMTSRIDVNGQVEVAAGGQLKVPTPCGCSVLLVGSPSVGSGVAHPV